ncbi:ATP-binding protein [Miniimonas arenae]|uniref:ATP-binding protein n=1 Tax=Miniimonas arenae TaxID=676201 RepID=UPI0028AAC05E|nr:ATP-binding protein [Miniimonas arenae]
MSSVELDAHAVVDILRAEGSDVADIEAKSAAGGYPEGLAPTLSAFGNLPGGGVVVLGLAESDGFAARGVYDVPDAKRRLAAQARDAVRPPLRVTFEDAPVDGQTVVIARVAELRSSDKPCIVTATGRAYLRSYDGDYRLSEQEVAAFVAERHTPRYDREPVPDSRPADLDPLLVASYLAAVRARSPRLALMPDDDVLRHTRVLHRTGELTLGGLYALGAYPQEFVPTLAISARVAPQRNDPPGTRSADLAHFDGPLPELLDQAVAWVRRNTATRVRFGPDGHGRDEPAYPSEALRELIANALVHRDIGPHALGERVHLVLEADRLVITNPGGLFGLSVDQLGLRQGGSARNQSLYDILKDVRTVDGRRVIEGVGTGIAAAQSALRDAGMTPPQFLDAAIRFTAIVPQHALLDREDLAWVAGLPVTADLTDAQRHALVAMRHGKVWTNREFRETFPMDSTQARAQLSDLTSRGLVVARGERGARTYRLDPAADVPLAMRTPSLLDAVEAHHEAAARAATAPRPGARANSTANADRIIAAIGAGSASRAEIVVNTGLSDRQVSYGLERLRDAGQVRVLGGRGVAGTRYELTT